MCHKTLAQNVYLGETCRTFESFSMAEGKEFSIDTGIGKYEYTENQMASILECVASTIQKCVVKAVHPRYFSNENCPR